MGAYSLEYSDVGGGAPFEVQLAPGQSIRIFSIYAEWDGGGASGTFLPCCSLYSQDDVLIARTRPRQEFAVGDDGGVTYAPFLRNDLDLTPGAVIGSPPYVILEDSGNFNVWRVLEGVPTRLTGYTSLLTFSEDQTNPLLSLDALTVVYSEHFPSGEGTVWKVDASGGTPAELVADASGDWLLWPFWNPGATRFAYSHGIGGAFRGDIVTRDSSGADPVTVYSPDADHSPKRPQYNHDGTLLAFIVQRDAGAGTATGLYVCEPDGTNLTRVADISFYRTDGSQFGWANSSDVLCFEDPARGLFVVNADGTGETQINTGGMAGQAVRCSKRCFVSDDSAVIVASQWFNGSSLVWRPYRVEADGSGDTRLNDTRGPAGITNFRCVYRHFQDDRIYFIEVATPTGGVVSSLAIDGTDYRVEHDITTGGVGTVFATGQGFEWL